MSAKVTNNRSHDLVSEARGFQPIKVVSGSANAAADAVLSLAMLVLAH